MDVIPHHSGIFAYVILPVMIFCARICDVTMGTIRVIFISKGDPLSCSRYRFFRGDHMAARHRSGHEQHDQRGFVYRLRCRVCGRDVHRYDIEEKISLGLTSVRIITKEDPQESAAVPPFP